MHVNLPGVFQTMGLFYQPADDFKKQEIEYTDDLSGSELHAESIKRYPDKPPSRSMGIGRLLF
jgi:hypothetical protein